MADSSTPARPRQVTTAAGLVIGGSLFLLVSVFDSITRLRSVDTRDTVTEALSSPAGEGLGLSVSQALELMRVGLTVAAVCAAVALVAGVFVLQKHRGARVALTVAAVPLLLTAPLTGGLLGALVVAATAVIWSGPARDWYAGRPVRESAWGGTPAKRSDGSSRTPGSQDDRDRSRSVDRPGATGVGGPGNGPESVSGSGSGSGSGDGTGSTAVATLPRVDPDGGGTSGDRPPATQGFGAPRTEQTPPAWLPQGQGRDATGTTRKVPAPLSIACLVTWIFSGMIAALYTVVTVVVIASPDAVLDPLRDSPQWQQALRDAQLTAADVESLLLPSMVVVLVLSILWAIGACVLAYLVRRGHNWARWTLIVSAGATFLLAIAAFPVGLVVQLAAAVVIGLLLHAETRDWFARRGQAGQTGPAGPPPPPPGQGRPGPW
ncbi:hypothetical protein ASG49_09395 [Marmoricola sp. Leaf446]|uniref:hypothetical protein n=1 Tax=Marmoricola sp. Leaf446 TaxID=1736379 RepID=UPI0006F75272|nr:hypothetical protein [Marmoricola sp. Leaf446]KQT92158.1 hypothetical protein ASG49_09395 [Marmoricola sp. Leaf446]